MVLLYRFKKALYTRTDPNPLTFLLKIELSVNLPFNILLLFVSKKIFFYFSFETNILLLSLVKIFFHNKAQEKRFSNQFYSIFSQLKLSKENLSDISPFV